NVEIREAADLVDERARRRDRYRERSELLPALARGRRQRGGDRRAAAGGSHKPRVLVVERDRRYRRLDQVSELPPRRRRSARPECALESRLARDAAKLRSGLGAVLPVQRKRHSQALRDARVGLPDLALRRDAEQHQRHRAHGYDDDDREEKKQAAAKAHSSMGRAERLPAHPLPKAPMGQLFESRGRLPAATMDCPRRDQAPLGAIAQLGERLDRTQEVGGSSPPSSIEGDAPATAGVLSFMDLSGSNWSQMAKLTCAATI